MPRPKHPSSERQDRQLDAEAAACAVLSGQASVEPMTGTSTVEMIRHIKIVRDAAVKAFTQAMQTLKSIIVLAPAELREQLEGIRGPITLVRHLASMRPSSLTSPLSSAKTALRATTRRWLALHQEIEGHDRDLNALVAASAPHLTTATGIANTTTAEYRRIRICCGSALR